MTGPGSSAGICIWINDDQRFINISEESWNYRIGGYRVCEKWLQDRKGRELGFDELSHYMQIVVACERSIALVDEIDADMKTAVGWRAILARKP